MLLFKAHLHLLDLSQIVKTAVIFIMQFHITFAAWEAAYLTQTNPVNISS
jgi:hypothetical protein